MSEDRRTPPHDRRSMDEAKFSTQRLVTYILLTIFAAVSVNVLLAQDQAERSTILQTVINLTTLAVGYWLGSSKQGQESAQSVNRIAEAAPAVAAAVVAAAAPTNGGTLKTGEVNVDATGGDVTVNK